MQALVVILIVLLAIFVVVATVLIVMAVGLSRDISRTQQNIRKINENVDGVMTLASVATSISGLIMKAKKTASRVPKRGSKK